jgi:predicted Zn finger-like uncharacterized protein
MNIQCQQCGTSYAVADEKVRGRLMKVRCKSCSEVIRVDGTVLGLADGSSAPPQQSEQPSGQQSKPPMNKPAALVSRPGVEGAAWHIAVGDGTQGPYTLDELREYYAQGSVLLDTLVFHEGDEEWRPAGEVPELAAPSQPQSHTQAGALAFAGGVSMGSDPFSERRPQSQIKSPRVSAAEMFDENAKSEHTVQFSLDQIRALSSASQPVAPSAISVSPPRATTSAGSSASYAGYASGDGSGLIDVRKLAELHRTMTEQESPRAEIESSSLIPSHGSYAHTLAPLSLPLPAAAAPGAIDGKTKLIAGLAAFGMVLAAAVGVLALTRPAPVSEPAFASAAQPVGAEPTVAAAAEEDEKAAPAEEAKAEEAEAKAEAAEPAAKEDKDDDEPARASRSGKKAKRDRDESSSGKKGKRDSDADESEPVAKAKPEKLSAKDSIDDLLSGDAKPKKSGSSAGASIDELLDGAVSGKKSAPKPEEKPASNLPQTPGRDEMLAALGKAKTKAAKCKGPGVATAQIQIAGSGKVTSVKVTGAEGPGAACVEKAVRSTSFPKFQKDNFEVKFPFKLAS